MPSEWAFCLCISDFECVCRLKELLRTRLIECGWRDELKQHCKGNITWASLASLGFLKEFYFIFILWLMSDIIMISSKLPLIHWFAYCTWHFTCFVDVICVEVVRQKGLENITVDDLVAEITPKGRGMCCTEMPDLVLFKNYHISLCTIVFFIPYSIIIFSNLMLAFIIFVQSIIFFINSCL